MLHRSTPQEPQGPVTTHQPLLITVEEAAKMLSLGKTTIYEMINNEGLPVHRFKSAVRISVTELQEWLESRKEQEEED